MTVQVKIGDQEDKTTFQPLPDDPEKSVRITLNIRRALNGNLMIFDHGDIDIVIDIEKNKIVTFPKEIMSDIVYGAQDRLMDFLIKKGIIQYDSVQGGNVFGSLEGDLQPGVELNSSRMALINITKWIEGERPYFEFVESYEDINVERFTDPEESDSTELGEVPHDESKGSLRPGYNYGPYWQNYTH